MCPSAIQVRGLSKRYRLGVLGYGSLQQDFASFWARLRGREDPNARLGTNAVRSQGGVFWALRDLDFEVAEGEVLGIIGRNGAGKSTLLKLLANITAPTSGEIALRGRLASLLEVGTGFHPELTGRENVFINGAILGMTKQEITRKFDEIVDFSGVETFIDTPVKRYSSGMYVRLAFAVAAHLEAEILLVDEVLAVGDAEFQKKCLGKMGEVAKGGRTVLFVSHNLTAVRELCGDVCLLDDGQLVCKGSKDDILGRYQQQFLGHDSVVDISKHRRKGLAGLVLFESAYFENEKRAFNRGEAISFCVEFRAFQPFTKGRISLSVYTDLGEVVGSSFSPMVLSAQTSEKTNGEGLPEGFRPCPRTLLHFHVHRHRRSYGAAP